MDIKRYHTSKKAILHFADLDLKKYDLDRNFYSFMEYIDRIEKPTLDALSTGQWKKLFAVLRILTDKTNINYCIYQNQHNIFFDVTTNCLGLEDEIVERDDGSTLINNSEEKESIVDKLKRYKYELSQVDLKIAHLQSRRKEYLEKIEPLKQELSALLDEVSDL